VVSQSEPAVRIWVQKRDGSFPKRAKEIEGRSTVVKVKTRSLDLALPLATIFDGIC